MLNKLKKSDAKGFTIIEVMIVLAIAGLIILIVLLAVPALQRNGRNTAIKNDSSAITAAIAEFASNNDGALPLVANSTPATGGTGPTVTINNATGNAATAKIQSSTVVNWLSGAQTITPKSGEITVDYKSTCPTVVSGTAVTTVASNRGTAVVYGLELASSIAVKCIDS